MKKKFSYLKKILSKICLGDKCLIIFMIIIFFHVTFDLFIGGNGINSEETVNGIDIIVRTTIASIFGYFISSNFVKDKKEVLYEKESNKYYLENENSNKAYLNDNNKVIINNNNENLYDENKKSRASEEQIVIVFIIGLVSLILLLLVRDFIQVSDLDIPIISQLRDIVCGCVGFLLGCPSNHK
ncbi:hypothetical protein DVW12_13895 [Clostridium botulinum]|uniref:hypothetical protein n=1 Tax=Clostridium sp. VAP41 TaxID=2949979 RepID=UPI0020793FFB|nr:hypothetical protein [Clostridium sp. VAP41]MBN1039796.1 hypothetical protein [Clostridium botulinum]